MSTELFTRLSELLRDNSAYWRCQPFVQKPHWADSLDTHLRAIDDKTLMAAQAHDSALIDALSPALPVQCEAIRTLCQLPAAPINARPTPAEPPHVPGRKWAQINAFCDALAAPELPLLDWCSGKAHLGRELQRRCRQAVSALEIDPALVDAGTALNGQDDISLHCCDVLSTETRRYLKASQQVVALHACGELHRKLLRDAVATGCQRVSWSPCCYHKFLPGEYHPLSQLGEAQQLQLTNAEIRGAVRQNSTAGHAEKRRFAEHQGWRLGFDTLQRKLRGNDCYLPTPPLNRLNRPRNFRDFAIQAARYRQLDLPKNTDFGDYEAQGHRRYQLVARQELVRELFRRPLELWLVLDQMLFMEEQGYRCEWKLFCEERLTPRNIVVDAVKG